MVMKLGDLHLTSEKKVNWAYFRSSFWFQRRAVAAVNKTVQFMLLPEWNITGCFKI